MIVFDTVIFSPQVLLEFERGRRRVIHKFFIIRFGTSASCKREDLGGQIHRRVLPCRRRSCENFGPQRGAAVFLSSMDAQLTAQTMTETDLAGVSAHNENEDSLVRRARSDREAFGVLYRSHAPWILAYLLRRSGDSTVAEDLTAETFLRALTGIRNFRSQGIPFRFWLYRIATNLANSAVRRRRWRSVFFGGSEHHAEAVVATPERDEAVLQQDARAALSALPAHDQSLLVLRFVEGLSIDEVARILQCPPGTVQSRTARARERLRRRLERSN